MDEKLNYLVARPDGLINDDGIIQIKFPMAAQDIDVKDAVQQNVIKYLRFHGEKLRLKENSDPYYHVQGTLHVTKRKYCYIIVWTHKGIFSHYLINNMFSFETYFLLN